MIIIKHTCMRKKKQLLNSIQRSSYYVSYINAVIYRLGSFFRYPPESYTLQAASLMFECADRAGYTATPIKLMMPHIHHQLYGCEPKRGI